jgi:hypothetical protein
MKPLAIAAGGVLAALVSAPMLMPSAGRHVEHAVRVAVGRWEADLPRSLAVAINRALDGAGVPGFDHPGCVAPPPVRPHGLGRPRGRIMVVGARCV